MHLVLGMDLAVNDLRVPLSALADEGVNISAVVPVSDLRPKDAALLPMTDVTVSGLLSPVGDEFLFHGFLKGGYAGVCDRCLVEGTEAFELDVTWTFAESIAAVMPEGEGLDEDDLDAEDLGVILIENSEIDLASAAWEELVLGAPSKFLCADECKGLCPGCGTNLNNSQCDCDEKREKDKDENQKKGLGQLAQLFPDLRPDDTED